MKIKITTLLVVLMISTSIHTNGQDDLGKQLIQKMSWGTDFEIELKLENDTIKVYNIEELHHTSANRETNFKSFTYYPVSLDKEFVSQLKEQSIGVKLDTSSNDTVDKNFVKSEETTLWSAIHGYIGGGWIHFVNTLLFSFEKGYLKIDNPLMLRPESNWRPRPRTESYKRTKKWEYYVPVNQRYAIKEYKKRKRKDELNDLEYLPDRFIELFLNTSNQEYKRLKKQKETYKTARIDLVKLLLGANYLSRMQINYIKHMVLRSINNYYKNSLPSVIIFDNFDAAVAMTLDEKGYHIQEIIFKESQKVSESQLDIKRNAIADIVGKINKINQEMFQKKLGNYYN